MKKLNKISLLILLTSAFMSCTDFKYKEQVLKAFPAVMYRIDAQAPPAAGINEVSGYRHGFKVLETYKLTADQQFELKTALTKEDNYSLEDTKRCLLMPAYLLENDTAFVVLSLSPCGKISFTDDGKEVIVDMAKENNIEAIITKIVSRK